LNEATPARGRTRASTELIVLITAMTLVAGYAAIRHGGLWGEVDTSTTATAMRAMLQEGQLIPQLVAYPNGYGFQALAVILVHVTSLSVAQLQIFGAALLAVWLVLPAWLAYRELTGSARGATLATALILVQPEFLFPILRGTHEKFTRGLMFLALYLLVRSILARGQTRRLAAFLLAFYLVIYALITFNNLMAFSFIAALGLALALNLGIWRVFAAHGDKSALTQRRLLYAVGISLLLAFIFTFYAYPPAQHGLNVVQSIGDRLALLFLQVEETTVNPYAVVSAAWISPLVYLLLSIANWLLLVLSFLFWTTQTLSWWRSHSWPDEPRVRLLWSLYGAFGFLGALSIAVDFSGALASNLQHRIFPTFAMLAAPVVAAWLVGRPEARPLASRLARGVLAVTIAFLAVLAVLKATNEPAVSNTWLFYTPAEFVALRWMGTANPNDAIWTEFDQRLLSAMNTCCSEELGGRRLAGYRPQPGTRAFLISDVVQARGMRLGQPLPIDGDSLRAYDNGAADIYRLRPRTPFQR
jgi:hypothetical protein